MNAAGQPVGVQDILVPLASGQDNELIGVYETEWLDFKGSPYRVMEPRERWELAKDVSALANRGGGVLVIGVQVEKDPTRNEDVASKIAPFPSTMFDSKQYRDILEHDVYPPIERLEILPFERHDAKMLVAVVAPAQDPDRQPFLITRFVEERGLQLHAFMLPKRSGSHTAFEPVGLVHRDIADGRRSRRLGTGGAPPPEVSPVVDIEAVEDRVRAAATELETQIEWTQIAVLFLAATPSSARPRPADFYAADGVRRALSTQDQLRDAGFGLTYGLDVRVIGRTLLSVDTERTVVRIDTSGAVLAGAAGTPEFLGWAQERYGNGDGRLRMNPVALVEYVLEFCRFVEREIIPRWGDDGWRLTALLRRAQTASRPLALRPGYEKWMFQARPAESDERIETIDRSRDPSSDAFELLSTVYSVFGMGSDDIPFTADRKVDEQALLGLQ